VVTVSRVWRSPVPARTVGASDDRVANLISYMPYGTTILGLRRAAALVASVLLAGLVGTGCAHGHTRPAAVSPSVSPSNSATTGAAGAALLLGEVQRELAAMKKTHYQHTTAVDEAIGKFDYDCSGMVDYALDRVLARDAQALPTSTSRRPLAGDIERFLHNTIDRPAQGWRAVTRVDQLGPGDLVAWLVTEDSTTGDTGHVMVVLDAPRSNATRNGEWLVQVADSTLSPHALDSRHQGETGLGTGTIGLVVDANGGPVAFYWKGGISEHAKPTEIALGEPA
jgi:hypothetical protein